MKQGKFFNGFNEAPIDFPPTFKYDVLRGLKRSKRTGPKPLQLGDRSTPLLEIEEPDDPDDIDDDGEGASLLSSAMTSVISHPNTEPGVEDDSYFYTRPSTPTGATSASKVSVVSSAANKARAKWLSLLSPSFGNPPNTKSLKRSVPSPITPGRLIPPSPLTPNISNTSSETGKRRFLRPPPMVLVNSPAGSQQSDAALEEKGVYDSSHKKRVPSWYGY